MLHAAPLVFAHFWWVPELLQVELLKKTHADGINGDTMKFVPEDWWNDSVSGAFLCSFALSLEHIICDA